MASIRAAGVLLIGAFVLFGIGATLPVTGPNRDPQVFTLPLREHLLAVASIPARWRTANIFMGSGFAVLTVGMAVLGSALEASGERVLSRLGLAGLLLAAVLWLVFSAFRAVVTLDAALETVSTGAVPAYYPPLARWGYALFKVYIVLGCLSLVAYGGSLLIAGLVPSWAGWATVGFSLAVLAHLLLTGDTLPAFHYFPALLIGILLVVFD